MEREKFFKYGLIFLLVLNIYSVGKLSNLKSELDNQRSYIDGQMNFVVDQVRSISGGINNFTRENQWIANSNKIIKIDPETKVITADVNWTFRELADGGKVYLLYKGHNEKEWEKIGSINTGGLNYSAHFELDSDEDYETQVLVESPGKEMSQELFYVSSNEFFYFYDIHQNSTISNQDKMSWNIDIFDHSKKMLDPEFQTFVIKDIKAEIYDGEKYLGSQQFEKTPMVPGDIAVWHLNGKSKGRISGAIYIHFENGYIRKEAISF